MGKRPSARREVGRQPIPGFAFEMVQEVLPRVSMMTPRPYTWHYEYGCEQSGLRVNICTRAVELPRSFIVGIFDQRSDTLKLYRPHLLRLDQQRIVRGLLATEVGPPSARSTALLDPFAAVLGEHVCIRLRECRRKD
jgi:hypothetical protein